jgi:nitrogen regulatory protein P-II 1
VKAITAIIQPARLYSVLTALRDLPGMPGLTASDVRGFARGHPDPKSKSHGIDAVDSFEMIKIECVVPDEISATVIETIMGQAHTGNPQDGKIFVSDVQDVVAIRTGLRGKEAI